eukprot:7229608-Prymnesium_polylepis.1
MKRTRTCARRGATRPCHGNTNGRREAGVRPGARGAVVSRPATSEGSRPRRCAPSRRQSRRAS